MTTTAIDIDPELMNRCLTLSVNESRDQTRAIHHHQRLEETLEGLFVKSRRQEIIDQHRNAQRLLKPVNVVNPYATQLTFVDDQTRTRRDHKKYLGLIRSIALLHQYQRPVKTHTQAGETKSYIEVTLEDIRCANQLAHEVLGRTLDELPPQTRKLLHQIHEWVEQQLENYQIKRSEFRFTRKQIRSVTHWGHTQLKVHLDRLEEMEYVLSYCSAKGGRSLEYELLYQGEGKNDAPFLMGLIDVQALNGHLAEVSSGVNELKTGQKRPIIAPKTGHLRGAQNEKKTTYTGINQEIDKNPLKKGIKANPRQSPAPVHAEEI